MGQILVPIRTMGGVVMKIADNEYDSNPEIHKVLSSTGCTGKTMKKDSDIFLITTIKSGLIYTSIGEKPSKPKKIFQIDSRKLCWNWKKKEMYTKNLIPVK